MKPITLDLWEPSPDNPNMTVYAGQRGAQEVFAELRHRLENVGMLPDEYLLLDGHWENGREIPKDAVIFSTVQYGASEGIYLDISIRWYEGEHSNIKCFATGKTLGESESHLDRMYLTASAVNKAFYSNEPHARYMVVGGKNEVSEGSVLHLNGAERRVLIDSLVERRNRLLDETTATEHLLRRVAGSITEFVNEVGAKPLAIDHYDKAVIAITDGNMAAFREAFDSLPDRAGELLIHAAGRPGNVGYNMTSVILVHPPANISNETYLTACTQAIKTGDTARVLMLANIAGDCVAGLDMGLYGKIISEAMSQKQHPLALALVKQCTSEQIQAGNSYMLPQALYSRDTQLAFAMADKGIDMTGNGRELIYSLKYHNNDWMLKHLLDRGMVLDNQNHPAMQACIERGSVEMGKLLIDRDMDFEEYEQWAANDPHNGNKTFTALKNHWADKVERERPQPPQTAVNGEKSDIATRLAKGKAKADTHNAARPVPDTPRKTPGTTEH